LACGDFTYRTSLSRSEKRSHFHRAGAAPARTRKNRARPTNRLGHQARINSQVKGPVDVYRPDCCRSNRPGGSFGISPVLRTAAQFFASLSLFRRAAIRFEASRLSPLAPGDSFEAQVVETAHRSERAISKGKARWGLTDVRLFRWKSRGNPNPQLRITLPNRGRSIMFGYG